MKNLKGMKVGDVHTVAAPLNNQRRKKARKRFRRGTAVLDTEFKIGPFDKKETDYENDVLFVKIYKDGGLYMYSSSWPKTTEDKTLPVYEASINKNFKSVEDAEKEMNTIIEKAKGIGKFKDLKKIGFAVQELGKIK